MKRFILAVLCLTLVPLVPASCEPIRWVNFDVPYESLQYAMQVDIESMDQEKHISWIDILAIAACRTGGRCPLSSVKLASSDLHSNLDIEKMLGELYKYYPYYKEAYSAVLGGLLGSFSIEKDGIRRPSYGLKAFSPVADG